MYRSRRNSAARALEPTTRVTTLVSPSSVTRWATWRSESPSPFSSPKSLGSCEMVTKIARPKTKPAITGRDRKFVTNPSRHRPATTNRIPVMMTNAAASSAKCSGLGWRAVTVEKTSTAEAEVPATTSCRLVPKIAYSASEASRV
jgi:hypothetical protein